VKVESAFYAGVAAFFVLIGLIYWFASYERAGSTLLFASTLLGLLTAAYLFGLSRRYRHRPEDRPDASQADGAGVVGRFPGPSPWPVGMAFGVTMAATGLAIGSWLAFGGAIIFVYSTLRLIGQSWAGMRGDLEGDEGSGPGSTAGSEPGPTANP